MRLDLIVFMPFYSYLLADSTFLRSSIFLSVPFSHVDVGADNLTFSTSGFFHFLPLSNLNFFLPLSPTPLVQHRISSMHY